MKHQWKLLFVLLLNLFGGQTILSQNLVPNGDFEEDIICFEFNQKCGPMGWRLTSSDPPSYYSEYKNGDTVASAHWTSIVPFSLSSRGMYREYLQATLLCPLEKGRKYNISMQVKAEEFAVKEIQVHFSEKYILTNGNVFIDAIPHVRFVNEKFWFDPNKNWITLAATYTARGDEKYMIIGNFLPQPYNSYKEIDFEGKEKRRSTYYVDNVLLKPTDGKPVCDYTENLVIARNSRWRHTSTNFFLTENTEIPVPFDVIPEGVVKKEQAIILKNIFFDVDKYELLPKSYAELQKLVTLLSDKTELLIVISGHTDNTGDEIRNQELSENRAKAVADYLISQGIDRVRVSSKGYASTKPIATNETPEGRQMNRRVEFVLK